MKRRIALALVSVGLIGGLSATAEAAAAPSEADQTWMIAAHQNNLTEIAAGNSALERATSDNVREIAQMLIDHHTQMDAELVTAATELTVELPDAPTPEQQAALARVEAQQGDAYDAAWVAEQIAGHQTALEQTRTEITSGTDPTVVQLATAAAPIIEQHLAALQAATVQPAAVPTGDAGLLADPSGSSPWPWVLAGTGAALLLLAAGTGLTARRRA